jgi:hypothetical protein
VAPPQSYPNPSIGVGGPTPILPQSLDWGGWPYPNPRIGVGGPTPILPQSLDCGGWRTLLFSRKMEIPGATLNVRFDFATPHRRYLVGPPIPKSHPSAQRPLRGAEAVSLELAPWHSARTCRKGGKKEVRRHACQLQTNEAQQFSEGSGVRMKYYV